MNIILIVLAILNIAITGYSHFIMNNPINFIPFVCGWLVVIVAEFQIIDLKK